CAASELKCACEAPRPDRVRGRRIRPKELSPKYRVRSFAQKKRFRMTASQKGGNPRSRLPIAALRPRIVVEEPCTRQFVRRIAGVLRLGRAPSLRMTYQNSLVILVFFAKFEAFRLSPQIQV